MKKMLLVLVMVLLPIVAMGKDVTSTPMFQTGSVSNQRQDFAPDPMPPLPPLPTGGETYEIYLIPDSGLPFGEVVRDKTGTHRVIHALWLRMEGAFIVIPIARGLRSGLPEKIVYIPVDKIDYIITVR